MPESSRPGVLASYRDAYSTLRQYFPMLLAIAFVFSILSVVPQIVDGLVGWAAPQPGGRYANGGMSDPISVIARFAYTILVVAPLGFGLSHVFLTAGRGRKPGFSGFFSAARWCFGSAVRGSLLLAAVGLAVPVLPVLFGDTLTRPQANGYPVGLLGLLGLIVMALYIGMRLAFFPYFLADYGAGIFEAISDSWEATAGRTVRIVAVILIGSLLTAPLTWSISLASAAVLLTGGALAAIAGPVLGSLAFTPAMVVIGLALASLYELHDRELSVAAPHAALA